METFLQEGGSVWKNIEFCSYNCPDLPREKFVQATNTAKILGYCTNLN